MAIGLFEGIIDELFFAPSRREHEQAVAQIELERIALTAEQDQEKIKQQTTYYIIGGVVIISLVLVTGGIIRKQMKR